MKHCAPDLVGILEGRANATPEHRSLQGAGQFEKAGARPTAVLLQRGWSAPRPLALSQLEGREGLDPDCEWDSDEQVPPPELSSSA